MSPSGSSAATDEAGGFLWSRHANPWSVWTLLAAYPALIAGIYRRHRRMLTVTLLFVAVNPFVFRPPADDDAWATRVVLGERRWMDDGLRSSIRDGALVACAAPVHLFTLRSAVERDGRKTVLGTVASLALVLLFFERMTRLYESRED